VRIITGRFKGANLMSVEGKTTRPTTSFHREVIFSMYQDYEGKRVLDLYAGTGGLGLEALSRGAAWVDFVEFASSAIAVLLKNIQKLRCADECHIHRRKVEAFLKTTPEPYDLIFMDPPYAKDLVNPTLRQIFASGLLKPDGLVIVEHSSKEAIAEEFQEQLLRHKHGKITSLSLLSGNNVKTQRKAE